MKTVSKRLAGTLVMGAMGAMAFAGLHEGDEVVINTVKGRVTGDLGYVHHTADSVQYIGCWHSAASALCYGVDSTGLSRTCVATNPADLEVIRNLKSDSHLLFGWNTDGTCKALQVNIDSKTVPK